MKTLIIMALSLLISGCANAQSKSMCSSLDVVGTQLPAIRHMNDMKMSADTLLFVYECEGGYGQQYLRRAVVDTEKNKLSVSNDMGKREGGYYVSDMPYPFITSCGSIGVISRDNGEVYSVSNDTVFIRTKQYLLDDNFKISFPLSQYVQDVFAISPDRYVFIGREPKGGRQFAMTTDMTSSEIDTIRQVNISPDLQAWMPNAGEMAYSDKYDRLAFAYRLHPIIEIFGLDGKIIKSVRVGDDTFDVKTLCKADFEDLNTLHTVDITYTPDFIYAIYWGYKFKDSKTKTPTILKLDWKGNIIDRYTGLPASLRRIAAVNNSTLIGWDGNNFIKLTI